MVLLFGLLLAVAGPIGVVQPADAAVKQQQPGPHPFVQIDVNQVDSSECKKPNVACRFEVQFFGFPAGTNVADVSFQLQPPSGNFNTVAATEGRTSLTFPGQAPAGSVLNHTEYFKLETAGLTTTATGKVEVRVDIDVRDVNGDLLFNEYKVIATAPCPAIAKPGPKPEPEPKPEPPEAGPIAGPGAGPGAEPDDADAGPGPVAFPAGIEGPTAGHGPEGSTGEGSGSTGTNNTATNVGWIALFGGATLAGTGLLRLLRRRAASDA